MFASRGSAPRGLNVRSRRDTSCFAFQCGFGLLQAACPNGMRAATSARAYLHQRATVPKALLLGVSSCATSVAVFGVLSGGTVMPLWTIRSIAWMAVLALVVLSVVPGDVRPNVMGDKHLEHLAAYVITGLLFALGYSQLRLIIFFGVLLTICAAMLEIAQLAIIGRTSSVSDFVASSVGAWIGLAVGYFSAPHPFARWLRPSHDAATD
jgi:hypothetical protein